MFYLLGVFATAIVNDNVELSPYEWNIGPTYKQSEQALITTFLFTI